MPEKGENFKKILEEISELAEKKLASPRKHQGPGLKRNFDKKESDKNQDKGRLDYPF